MAEKVTNGTGDVTTPAELPGTVRLNGVTWPWLVTQESLDTLKAYDVWQDDVWVTTYPKAGTHWVLEIVNLIFVDGHQDKINRDQQSYPVEFDRNQPGRSQPNQKPPPAQYKTMTKWEAPRAIMTHLTEELMPTQIYQGKGKVVYVIRNPKDITVSNWNFMKQLKFDPRYEDWDYFARTSFSDDMVFGSWFTHVLNFWKKHRYDKNFLFIKFEDIKKDTRGAVIQIADFLGRHLSEDAIDRVVEFSSLKSMKTLFNSSQPNSKDAAPESFKTTSENAPSDGQNKPPASKRRIGAPSIIRKGIVGDWKSKFTVAQNEALNALFEENMAGSGLKIDFE